MHRISKSKKKINKKIELIFYPTSALTIQSPYNNEIMQKLEQPTKFLFIPLSFIYYIYYIRKQLHTHITILMLQLSLFQLVFSVSWIINIMTNMCVLKVHRRTICILAVLFIIITLNCIIYYGLHTDIWKSGKITVAIKYGMVHNLIESCLGPYRNSAADFDSIICRFKPRYWLYCCVCNFEWIAGSWVCN